MEIPQRLAHLPVCPRRNVPVPYANITTEDGQHDFTALDSAKVVRLAAERRCGICEDTLDYWIVFLGGERSAQSRAYTDPPMHEECARFAARTCPYVTRAHMSRRKTPLTPDTTVPKGFSEDKPAEFLLYFTRSYKHQVTRDGVLFRPAPAVRLERCGYSAAS
ncbi:hypothetical protein [Actinomadura sp. K4S16]|uniref:hypothetical protein n=1 Tax=Actinomadura sp. K4S16 TaxID=1316147 RepID=UPI0011F06826|nr:hypothetical protein [Actinomadura sp. K4S16]